MTIISILFLVLGCLMYGWLMANFNHHFPTTPGLVKVLLCLIIAFGTSILLPIGWILVARTIGSDMPWEKGWELF